MSTDKIVICGAAGAQGQEALNLLRAARPDVALRVVDRQPVDAARCGGSSVVLDLLGEPARLRAELEGASLVLNFAGPFYRLGAAVLDAAIDVGARYVDICDDVDATEVMLARNEAARESGTVAIVGLGAAPGTTNLLVRLALDYLGGLRREGRADIAWCAPGSELTFGIFEHLVHCFRTALPGRAMTPDWDELEPRLVAFADPIGSLEVVRLGHPEPLTLQRSLGCACVLRGGMTTPGLLYKAWELARACDAGRTVADAWAELKLVLPHGQEREPSGMSIDVSVGARGVRFESATTISMEQSTAVPAVAGALMLLENAAPPPGVWPPEALSPLEFFEAAGSVSPGGGGLRAYAWDGGVRGPRLRMRDLFATRKAPRA